ncbi:hypothetical protein BV924_20830 [Pectobacterium odoriferum]|uniref:Uncharacterized protein n=1 Tax=Pectobacterium odoriferum TaxID=78398 RepID=A0ABD6VK23_9GAMM|nr:MULTISPECIES: hypothetical protein [Pectobacterium]POD97427.1 hypothetical protein BVY06_02925 [Pectobacterium odoriferum]POE08716.1 hypothetical protein BV924_20830 [Pectobacterium odoriferum]POE23250.1 hypothetical protein BV926_20760 [Pectobacterium odoriferum]POE27911.1 hypothetical protein BV919_20410 [Pectobacterium odoriferum]POE42567.1 hypothetical protein BV920_02415 [Pectobacterium odoriferum]
MTEFEINSPLLHLALLETLKRDDIHDEIDLFLPFIAVTAAEIAKPLITVEDIQEKLKESFGFRPPLSAIKVLMARAKKRGILIRENYSFIPVHEKITEWKNGFEHKKEDVEVSLSSLKREFICFTETQFGKTLTGDDAEKLITHFIEVNVSSVITERTYKKMELAERIKNTNHVIASFISHIHRNQPSMLEHFNRCVKGMLLANYLFYADKVSDKKSYTGITVYLDSPIVLGLLGYSGKQAKEAYSDFLNLLKSLGINTLIFDRTLNEIEGLLYAWKNDLSRKRYERFNTKTLEWLRAQGYDAERIDTDLKLLESNIIRLGIEVRLGFKPKTLFQCNEEQLETAIGRAFHRDKNLEHDTVCISRVHNLREGKTIKDLSQSFPVFVTPNTGLVKVANEFFRHEIGRNAIPIVVSEQWMTAMFWLKKPDIYSSLPQEQLLSTAYSLLYTDDRFWDAFVSRLEHLKKRGDITQEDFMQIRWDSDLLRLVHDVSVEVGEDFSEEDVFDVVNTIKTKNEEKHRGEMAALEDRAQQKLSDARDEASQEIKALSDEKDTALLRLENLERKIRKISSFIAGMVAWSFSALLLFVFSFAAVKGIPDEMQPVFMKSELLRGNLPGFALILTAVFGVVSSVTGIDLAICHKRIKACLEKWLLSMFI